MNNEEPHGLRHVSEVLEFINNLNYKNMESNISRDHIALEAMKVIISVSHTRQRTLWDWFRVLFLGKKPRAYNHTISENDCARCAYEYADAMIARREEEF